MNALKKIIYQFGVPFVGRIFHRKNKYINVIYYHDIVSDEGYSFDKLNVGKFKRQMLYLIENGYETVRFDDIRTESDLMYHPKRIIIAFDDGWRSNFTEIYDFMKSHGLKYNIYLETKQIVINSDYLTWEQVKQMHKEGVVGFGAHTYNHPDMSDINKINPVEEFDLSNRIFKEQLGFQPLDFCYPYGYYSEESNKYILENTDYLRIYTSKEMYSYKQKDKVIFGRSGISNDDSFRVFKAKLKGYFNVWSTIIK